MTSEEEIREALMEVIAALERILANTGWAPPTNRSRPPGLSQYH